MYYGLFVRVDGTWLRVDVSQGYTLETAKVVLAPTVRALIDAGLRYEFRKLPPVKQIDVRGPDKKYAKTPW